MPKNQSLFFLDRPADEGVEVLNVLHAVWNDEPEAFQGVVDVVALPAFGRPAGEAAAAQHVAAVFRNHVHAHAAGLHFGADAARLEADLLPPGKKSAWRNEAR